MRIPEESPKGVWLGAVVGALGLLALYLHYLWPGIVLCTIGFVGLGFSLPSTGGGYGGSDS